MDVRRVGGAPTLGGLSELRGSDWWKSWEVDPRKRFGDGDRILIYMSDRERSGCRPRDRSAAGSFGSFGRSVRTGSTGFRLVIRRTPRGPSPSTESLGFLTLGGARESG